MTTETVTLTRDQAVEIKSALEVAGNTVTALEWITDQTPETTEMAGAFEAIKACMQKLDRSIGGSCDHLRNALTDAGVKAANHG